MVEYILVCPLKYDIVRRNQYDYTLINSHRVISSHDYCGYNTLNKTNRL